MDQKKLENLGQSLGVDHRDVKQLKRHRKNESIGDVFEITIVKVLALFSFCWGAMIPILSTSTNRMGYPVYHSPPGGVKSPILIMGGGVGTIALLKAGHITLKNPPEKKHQLFMVRSVATIVFVAFCVGYAFGFFPVGMGSWSLYNVYSRDDQTFIET